MSDSINATFYDSLTHGRIWGYAVGNDGVMAFTDVGIETLMELIRTYKENPKTWSRQAMARYVNGECPVWLPFLGDKQHRPNSATRSFVDPKWVFASRCLMQTPMAQGRVASRL